jgi:two-component system NtrC family sensor kinase
LSDALAAQAVKAAAALGETFLPFLESLPWPVIVVDEGGRVVYASKELLSGGALAELTRPPALSELFPEYSSVLRGDVAWLMPQDVEIVRQTADGPVYEHIWLRRLPWGACLIIMDQTEMRQSEIADAQTARLASLGFMVAGVSHELSNPLAAIYSMVQILQSKRDVAPETLEMGLANIAANVKRMLEVSRRLVGFSRVSDEPRAPFRVDEAVDDAIAVLRQDRSFGQIEVDHRPDPDALVFGNQGQIQQVFYNIFLNAIQAMQGRGRLSIVTRRELAGGVEVIVRDSGPGIPSHILPRIFEPFFTTKLAGQGTGLGLSISSEIAQEHGGTIRAENGTEAGACFLVQMPLYEIKKRA